MPFWEDDDEEFGESEPGSEDDSTQGKSKEEIYAEYMRKNAERIKNFFADIGDKIRKIEEIQHQAFFVERKNYVILGEELTGLKNTPYCIFYIPRWNMKTAVILN